MSGLSLHENFLRQCIALSQASINRGDAPFGSLVVRDGKIIASSENNASGRVSDHAEVLALHAAHQATGSSDLSGATLYTNCEPCPMCSFMAREYKISTLVYALPSPYMGGHTKWSILEDEGLSAFPRFFGPVPEIIGGLLEHEAKEVFRNTPFDLFGKEVR